MQPRSFAPTCLFMLALGCAGGTSTPVVDPAPPPPPPAVGLTGTPVALRGPWSPRDADAVAQAIVTKCLTAPWSTEYRAENGRKPVVRLYPVRNKTDGYIDYRYFTKQIEAALVSSGQVEVVSSLEEAEVMRDEREDQSAHAGDETAKPQGDETGSDFVLNGWLISQEDESGGQRIRAYLMSVEVTNTQSNKKAWIGQHRLRKVISE